MISIIQIQIYTEFILVTNHNNMLASTHFFFGNGAVELIAAAPDLDAVPALDTVPEFRLCITGVLALGLVGLDFALMGLRRTLFLDPFSLHFYS